MEDLGDFTVVGLLMSSKCSRMSSISIQISIVEAVSPFISLDAEKDETLESVNDFTIKPEINIGSESSKDLMEVNQ